MWGEGGERAPELEAAIAARGLRKEYGANVALHELTLTVPPGEVFGFLGPNGAGKTTAVKLLTGLARPSAGQGWLLGRPLGDREARRGLGFLPELFRFHDWLSAAEVLRLHGELLGMTAGERKRRVPEVLELTGLADRAKDRVGTFSKGMQQRLGLAQALINGPRLVILDEPTSALDPIGRRDVRLIIQELKRQGVTIFLNSHLLSEIELVCDRVAIVDRGRVVREGRLEDLLDIGHELEINASGLSPAIVAAMPTAWRIREAPAGWEQLAGARWPAAEMSGLARAGRQPGRAIASELPAGAQRLVLSVPGPEAAPDVTRFLVANGVDLLELRPRRTNLEDLFLQWVEGGDGARLDIRPLDPARSVA